MLTKILNFLGDAADVRTVAAIVAGVLVTLFNPAHSATVIAVVDALAGAVVAVDTAFARTTTKTATTSPTGVTTISTTTAPTTSATIAAAKPVPIAAPPEPVTVEGAPAAS